MDLLWGRPVADRIDRGISGRKGASGLPHLVVYRIGDDPASASYSRAKVGKGEKLGAKVTLRGFPREADPRDVISMLREDASSPDVHGIMVERPLPSQFDLHDLMFFVPAVKDVEGIVPENYGLLAEGRPYLIPPTPLGVVLLMLHYGIELNGRNVVVIGRSLTVGRPVSLLLSERYGWANSTVTLLHSGSPRDHPALHDADVVVSSVGKAGHVRGEMLKKGAKVIDVGINIDANGRTVGDIDMDSVRGIASAATPTPGGTGPVTVSAIFLNLLRAWCVQKGETPVHDDPLVEKVYGKGEG